MGRILPDRRYTRYRRHEGIRHHDSCDIVDEAVTMYTVDASVWVNAFDQREPGHMVSRQFLEILQKQSVPTIVPNLLLAEVAGAISRTRRVPAQARAFAIALSQLPHVTVRQLDEIGTDRALTLAAQHGLRGADAVYAAVASDAGTTLVTLDNEHLIRLVNILPVLSPAAALAALASQR